MFEDVVGESLEGDGCHVSDEFDGMWERLLADPDGDVDLDADWDADLDALRDWLPPEWDDAAPDEPVLAYGTCTPSGWLALDLDSATTDPAGLSDDTLVEAMVGFDRVGSWAAARQARLLAELARRRPTDRAPYSARWAGVGSEYAPDEVGVALHLSRGTACARIGLACRLLATLPDTFALWEAGRIDTAKARAVDDATVVLSDELARAVEARVLPRAPEQTLAQLKAALARAVIAADPDGAEARHRQARRDRRVVVTAEPDGMGTLWAMLTATDAAGAFTWLTRLARGLGAEDPAVDGRPPRRHPRRPAQRPPPHRHRHRHRRGRGRRRPGRGDTRDDERRQRPTATAPRASTARPAPTGPTGADRVEVATGAGRRIQPVTPGKPLIQVVIPYSTLIGADDQPAELVGHGPIPASLAREVGRGRDVAPAGHRPAVGHPARPRPHHLPPTRRARRPRPRPRRPLQIPRLPPTRPPTPNSITSPPGPTAAPPANPTSPPTAPITTGSNTTPRAGTSTPTPTAG